MAVLCMLVCSQFFFYHAAFTYIGTPLPSEDSFHVLGFDLSFKFLTSYGVWIEALFGFLFSVFVGLSLGENKGDCAKKLGEGG